MTSSIQQPNGAPEEPVRVNHTVRNIIIAAIVVVLVAVGGFFGLRVVNGSKTADAKGTESNPVKIGVVGGHRPAVGGIPEKGQRSRTVCQDR